MEQVIMGEHLKKILSEMCNRVDTTFDQVDFLKKDWYLKKSWTSKEQESFSDWFVNYLKKNSGARNEIMAIKSSNTNRVKKVVDEFIFNYGWKTK